MGEEGEKRSKKKGEDKRGEIKTGGKIKKGGGEERKATCPCLPALPCPEGCAGGCGWALGGAPSSGGAGGGAAAHLPAQHRELGKAPEGAGRGHQEPWECRQPGLGQLKERSTRNIKLTHFSSMTGRGCRWAAKPCFQENSRTEQHLCWTTAQFASCCSAGLGTLFWTLVWAGGSVPELGWVPGPLCVLLPRPLAVLLCCLGWWLRTRSHKAGAILLAGSSGLGVHLPWSQGTPPGRGGTGEGFCLLGPVSAPR